MASRARLSTGLKQVPQHLRAYGSRRLAISTVNAGQRPLPTCFASVPVARRQYHLGPFKQTFLVAKDQDDKKGSGRPPAAAEDKEEKQNEDEVKPEEEQKQKEEELKPEESKEAKGVRTVGAAGTTGGGNIVDSSSANSPPSLPARPTVPSTYPRLLALPITRRPLFPGFYKAVVIRNPQVRAAIKELLARGQPYIGAFLLKTEDDVDVIEDKNKVWETGVFCQITSVFENAKKDGESETLTAVLYPHRRIKMLGLVDKKGEAEVVDEGVVVDAAVEEKPATPENEGDVIASFEPEVEVEATKPDAGAEPARKFNPVAFLNSEEYSGVSVVDAENVSDKPYERSSSTMKALTAEIIGVFKEIAALNPLFKEQIASFSISQSAGNVFDDPSKLADFAAAVSGAEVQELQNVLESLVVEDRLQKALEVLKKELLSAQLQSKISKDIETKIAKRHKEHFLREQLQGIKRELGMESDGKDKLVEKFDERVKKLNMPEHVKKVFEEELNKLQGLEPQGSEFNVTRNYLDWLTQIPWGQRSPENFHVGHAAKVLDEDHYGLKDIKERILEFIAVGKLKGTVQGKILCFVGPPGVGKTSIGKSIARALDRRFFRFSVGGLTDVAEIKGHRRTYIGAMPGQMIQALKNVGVENPLVLIDEIDKIGRGHGDPSAALLELLDPEQNNSFLDHYLDVPVDLSKVLFVCTANSLDTIPGPLLDRMEVIELSGYIAQEKLKIAEKYLSPVAKEAAGLKDANVDLTQDAIEMLIKAYCRESGVRNLKKHIDKVYRKAAYKIVQDVGEEELSEEKALTEEGKEAKEAVEVEQMQEAVKKEEGGKTEERDQPLTEAAKEDSKTSEPRKPMKVPDSVAVKIESSNLKDYVGPPVFTSDRIFETTPAGVVMGLGVSGLGGSALYVESIAQNALGKHSKPGFMLTGHLGDVMKESASIASSYTKSFIAREFPQNRFFEKASVHLHFPAGSIQKDGPSAGITMATSLLSLAFDHALDPTIGMTGELTLSGKVLKIGGLREKAIAAKRSGVKTIIFPSDNKADWEEMPEHIKEGLEGKPAEWYKDVFEVAFKDLDKTRAATRWIEDFKRDFGGDEVVA
ncbi:ATP-dependent protease La [Saitoella complicata NRRL Y-17804]|nr:ATP-dependent protease La [Saitoella complicata NRRL Y-17804]ODQ50958.1 ATP-dependent protease La [Saitoella complicata NRRL Y-17804]